MGTLYRVEGSLALLSLLGSFLIILSYILMKTLRRHPTNLVFYLSICDFMFALKYAVTAVLPHSEQIQQNEIGCIWQAVFTQFFGLASISWNGIIAYNLIVNLRKPFVETSKLVKFYHLYVWSLCAITTVVMLSAQTWGASGDGTCWIEGALNLYRLMFFIPLVLYFVIGCMAVAVAFMSAWYFNTETFNARRNLVFRMFFYVAVFVGCWSGPLIHRVAQYWQYDDKNDVFLYLDAVGSSVQGFANALVWLSNPSIFSDVRQLLAKIPIFASCAKKVTTCLPGFLHFEEYEYLNDTTQDIQRMDAILRKNLIAFLIYGMNIACKRLHQHVGKMTTSPTQKDFKDKFLIRDLERQKDSSGRGLSVFLPISDLFLFVDYQPRVYYKLRALDGIRMEDYLASMQPDRFLAHLDTQKWAEGGRSGSFFCFSPDKLFIIKTIPKHEARILRSILTDYYDYIYNNPKSLLNRIYGAHAIRMQGGEQIYVIVMGNAFHTRNKIHERYDLKGSWVARNVGQAHIDNPSRLGMDIDLKRRGWKVVVRSDMRSDLVSQIEKDARFLCSLGIMDYSLLLGMHDREKAAVERAEAAAESMIEEEREARREEGACPESDHGEEEEGGSNKRLATSGGMLTQTKESFSSGEDIVYTGSHSEGMDLEVSPPTSANPAARGSKGKGPLMLPTREELLASGEQHYSSSSLSSMLEKVRDVDPGIISKDGTKVYYVGIIDMLQLYDMNKKLERLAKTKLLRKSSTGVSVQNPLVYRDRFISFCRQLIVSDYVRETIASATEDEWNELSNNIV